MLSLTVSLKQVKFYIWTTVEFDGGKYLFKLPSFRTKHTAWAHCDQILSIDPSLCRAERNVGYSNTKFLL